MFLRRKINSLVLWQQSRLTEWPQSVSVSVLVRLHQALIPLNSAVEVDILEATETSASATKRETVQNKNQQTYHAESVKQKYRTRRKQAGSGDNSTAGVTRISLFSYETITRPFFPLFEHHVLMQHKHSAHVHSTVHFMESSASRQI